MVRTENARLGSWLVLLAAVGASAACGGGTTMDSDPTDSSGGVPGVGGAASSGGALATGGAAASGGAGPSSGGAPSASGGGPSGSGGAPSSGGQSATGGSGVGGSGVGGTNGTGGVPGICGCDAAELPVCGVDGQTYSAGCGEICVPVEIACPGACPCDPNAGCGCTTSGSSGCDEGLMWECGGQDFDPMAPLDFDCQDTFMSAIRYCCPVFMTADDFCPQ